MWGMWGVWGWGGGSDDVRGCYDPVYFPTLVPHFSVGLNAQNEISALIHPPKKPFRPLNFRPYWLSIWLWWFGLKLWTISYTASAALKTHSHFRSGQSVLNLIHTLCIRYSPNSKNDGQMSLDVYLPSILINVKHMNFLNERHFSSFYYVHVTRKKLPKWRSYEKRGHLTLMKLTAAQTFWLLFLEL